MIYIVEENECNFFTVENLYSFKWLLFLWTMQFNNSPNLWKLIRFWYSPQNLVKLYLLTNIVMILMSSYHYLMTVPDKKKKRIGLGRLENYSFLQCHDGKRGLVGKAWGSLDWASVAFKLIICFFSTHNPQAAPSYLQYLCTWKFKELHCIILQWKWEKVIHGPCYPILTLL